MRRLAFMLTIAGAGLLASCEAICACSFPPPGEIVYGRVESSTGVGIPTAVVLYRIAVDTVCAFDVDPPSGELDVRAEGRFRDEIYSFRPQVQCLELRAFDPAVGKTDTTSILILADFASPDSTGVVLRLP